MSTFLEDGRVLLQIDYRYLVCDQNGNFVNEVQFDNIIQERATKETPPPRKQSIGKKRDKERIYRDVEEEVDSFNRMQLKTMSDDNKYFLFEDRIKREFRVYTLEKCWCETGAE